VFVRVTLLLPVQGRASLDVVLGLDHFRFCHSRDWQDDPHTPSGRCTPTCNTSCEAAWPVRSGSSRRRSIFNLPMSVPDMRLCFTYS